MDAGWLECLHRDNVTLVGDLITQITPKGIVTADGQRRDFDVIVYATGSDVAEHGVGVNEGLRGEDGVELKDYWKSIGGPQSYLGLAVPGVRDTARGGRSGKAVLLEAELTTVPELLHGAWPERVDRFLGLHHWQPVHRYRSDH